MVIVEDAFLLELLQGAIDVGRGADSGKDLMEYATGMDIMACGLFVVVGDKVLAAVALTELDLVAEGGDVDGCGEHWCEEGVVHRTRVSGMAGRDSGVAILEGQHRRFIIEAFECGRVKGLCNEREGLFDEGGT
jgi:hypothetical protein